MKSHQHRSMRLSVFCKSVTTSMTMICMIWCIHFCAFASGARFAEAMGEWTAKTIIVVLVTAFFSGVGFAIIHFVDAIARR